MDVLRSSSLDALSFGASPFDIVFCILAAIVLVPAALKGLAQVKRHRRHKACPSMLSSTAIGLLKTGPGSRKQSQKAVAALDTFVTAAAAAPAKEWQQHSTYTNWHVISSDPCTIAHNDSGINRMSSTKMNFSTGSMLWSSGMRLPSSSSKIGSNTVAYEPVIAPQYTGANSTDPISAAVTEVFLQDRFTPAGLIEPAPTAALSDVLPNLGSLIGQPGVEQLMELAAQNPAKAGLRPYKGHCRINTASVKVAAAHSDITTLGPLLQASLASALAPIAVESVLSDAVCFEGCVQLFAQIVTPSAQELQGSLPDADSGRGGDAVAAAQLLSVVQQTLQNSAVAETLAAATAAAATSVGSQQDELPPITVVWGQGLAVTAAGVGGSSAQVQLGTAVASAAGTPVAVCPCTAPAVLMCQPVCICAGQSCELEMHITAAAPSSSAAAAPCRLLVSQNGRLLVDDRVTLGPLCTVQLPAMDAGVVHVTLLPTEGPICHQLNPAVRQTLMVLPLEAAAEMQQFWNSQVGATVSRQCTASNVAQLQQQWDGISALAVDVAYLLGSRHKLPGNGAASPLSAQQAAVLKHLAAFLAAHNCWETLRCVASDMAQRLGPDTAASSGQYCSTAAGSTHSRAQCVDVNVISSTTSGCSNKMATVCSSSADGTPVCTSSKQPSFTAAAAASQQPSPAALQAGATAESSLGSSTWRSPVRQLLHGFQSPELEAAYVQLMTRQTQVADMFAVVYLASLAASLNIFTDPISSRGPVAAAAEVASRAVTAASLVLPTVWLVICRQRLLLNGRREVIIMWSEWCLAFMCLGMAMGLLPQGESVIRMLRRTGLGQTVLLWAGGAYKAAYRQVQARILLPPFLVESLANACTCWHLGNSWQTCVVKYVGQWLAGALVAVYFEMRNRRAFLEAVLQPAAATSETPANKKLKTS